jgi:hypothetical protein
MPPDFSGNVLGAAVWPEIHFSDTPFEPSTDFG